MRIIGMGGMDHDKEYIPLLVIRLFLLFIAVIFSIMDYINSTHGNPANPG